MTARWKACAPIETPSDADVSSLITDEKILDDTYFCPPSGIPPLELGPREYGPRKILVRS